MSKRFFLVLELADGGDLGKLLRRRGRSQDAEATYVVRQVAEALDFLHGRQVVHRDLKPDNVLITSQSRRAPLVFCTVKLADFGLSTTVGPTYSEPTSTCGTPGFMAPEVRRCGAHGCAADLWSLGTCLLRCVSVLAM
eukprot:TRINITY_DN7558_c0_g2_i2.p1 TRINITY_DN7558_c0_g2~~TRINITY_DN7558_c0_g2_i2.p1  ORF type:complete len:138 (+),score=18.99 TRINITY_DN7558_c0_g2_i2:99-512(+)